MQFNCPHKRETIKLESIGDVTVSELSIGDIESYHSDTEIKDNDIIFIVKKYSDIKADRFNDLIPAEIGYLYERILTVTFGEATPDEEGGNEDEKK